jgi:hypothetical protein
MFDGDPIEVGKVHDRFLTEESGRRIYFPLAGPARIVPSRDQEAKLREVRFFIFIAGFALIIVAAFVRAFWEWSIPLAEGWIVMLILGAHELITSRLVRGWTTISPAELSYAQYVMATYAKRGLVALCFTVFMRAIVFIGLIAALVWLATHPPRGWDEWTLFDKVSCVVPFALLIVAAFYVATSGHRAVIVLRNKHWIR